MILTLPPPSHHTQIIAFAIPLGPFCSPLLGVYYFLTAQNGMSIFLFCRPDTPFLALQRLHILSLIVYFFAHTLHIKRMTREV